MANKRRRVDSALDDEHEQHDHEESYSRQVKRSVNGNYHVRSTRVQEKKSNKPRQLPDWAPNAELEDWDVGDVEDLVASNEETICGVIGKKRYAASDEPMQEWVPFREQYVMEAIRGEARSEEARAGICVSCSTKRTKDGDFCAPSSSDKPLYRCLECFGYDNECLECCLTRHATLPLHRIEKWNDECFERITLAHMGLKVQLGHGSGTCSNPVVGPKAFTVLHTNGVHLINIYYCNCETRQPRRVQLLRVGFYPATVHFPATCATMDVLQHFHGLSLCSKVSAHEYYLNMERMTDNSRVELPKTRYRGFMRMVRQFRHIRMLKRGGRGNVENGVGTTGPGDLAVVCAACPQPGINMPQHWLAAAASMAFLHTLFVSIDANFRLKNRLRANERNDPGLHTGLAYFVPQEDYNSHILKFASQQDISSCASFNAISRADNKASAGLRYTGVGMCVCSRHELIRPLGVGNLQKGERYCNMDYIFLSAVQGTQLASLMAIYDIACQWKINLPTRMLKCPPALQLPASVTLDFAIPKCHCPAHQTSCQTPHSLNLKPGAGRTDGEGIERDWSMINPAANSTKEMGPGSRHDTLDDLFGYHNWQKTVGLGISLRRKYRLAVVESKRHGDLFNEFTQSIDPAMLKKWTRMIVEWEVNKEKPNPYVTIAAHDTETDVKLRLLAAERIDMNEGSSIHNETATAFLAMGLMVEESQRRLKLDVTEKELTSLQATQLQQCRINIMKQIKSLRAVQRSHMPVVELLLSSEGRGSARKRDVEDIKLFLPSSLSASHRASGCAKGLGEKEAELREAQCWDALERIRLNQRAKRYVTIHKKKSVPGQRTGTRARSEFDRLDIKIAQAVTKYRYAREALVELRGSRGMTEELPVLRDSDITPPPAFDIDDTAGARTMKEAARGLGEGKREVSWLWRTAGVGDGSDDELNEGLRVEWAKSRARYLRWKEEVLLCKEEMRRVRRTLEFKVKWWDERSTPWSQLNDDPALAQGVRAYAASQKQVYQRLLQHFTLLWEAAPSKFSKQEPVAPPDLDNSVVEDETLMAELLAEGVESLADVEDDNDDNDEEEGLESDGNDDDDW